MQISGLLDFPWEAASAIATAGLNEDYYPFGATQLIGCLDDKG
jgi:hypothetical protein